MSDEFKTCTQCGRMLPISEYYSNGNRKSSCCKSCHSANIKKTYDEKVDAVNIYKAQRGCAKCGERRFYLLEFHHKNPDEKEFGISKKIRSKFEDLLPEIEKCDVLCANCHREFHYLYTQGVMVDYDWWLKYWDGDIGS